MHLTDTNKELLCHIQTTSGNNLLPPHPYPHSSMKWFRHQRQTSISLNISLWISGSFIHIYTNLWGSDTLPMKATVKNVFLSPLSIRVCSERKELYPKKQTPFLKRFCTQERNRLQKLSPSEKNGRKPTKCITSP